MLISIIGLLNFTEFHRNAMTDREVGICRPDRNEYRINSMISDDRYRVMLKYQKNDYINASVIDVSAVCVCD